MSNFVEESVNQVNDINPVVDVDPVLNGVRNRDRNFQRNQRQFKHNQNGRNEVNNLYQYSGGYQNQHYNNNWSENVRFDQSRLSNYTNNYPTNYSNNTNAYNTNNSTYPTTTTNYPTNNNNNYTNTTTSTYPNTTTNYPTNNNNNYVHGYTNTIPLVNDGMIPIPINNTQLVVNQVSDTASLEEIAYLFTYRYYSLMNTNPTFMYSLYSKDAQLSKNDLNGKRIIAVDHNEIRNYYQQYANYVQTSNIQNIEIQLVSSHPLFLVIITGTYTLINEKENYEKTKQFAQTVLLSGDITRSRYHIINDLLVELNNKDNNNNNLGLNNNNNEMKQNNNLGYYKDNNTNLNKSPKQNLNNQNTNMLVVDETQTTTRQELLHDTNRNILKKENKDGLKLAIFGIPPMVTEVILTDLINKRLLQLNSKGKVVDVAIKPQKVNRKNNESLLYAFVELDSEEAVEKLLANELQIQDRNITLEPYKRIDKKKDYKHKNLTQNY